LTELRSRRRARRNYSSKLFNYYFIQWQKQASMHQRWSRIQQLDPT